jgi:hypothetical protein
LPLWLYAMFRAMLAAVANLLNPPRDIRPKRRR